LEATHAAGMARPTPPRLVDHWAPFTQSLAEQLSADQRLTVNGQDYEEITELHGLIVKLERKLEEFDGALGHEPRTIDRDRAEYLEMLARYAQQLAVRIVEVLRSSALLESSHASVTAVHQRLSALAAALLSRAEARARRTWDQRFAWAAADGRQ